MHLAYFDENKFTEKDPHFVIGGFLVPDNACTKVEKDLAQIQFNFFGSQVLRKETEFHGKDMLHGKGNFKRRSLEERIALFKDLASVITKHKLAIRLIFVDVMAHRQKYDFPTPEYRLGLMLVLEQFASYLDNIEDVGLVFGDYEKDEITEAIVSFSEYKMTGTPFLFGRSIDSILDTVYFTQSHHSRFLQLADVIVYLASRYEIPDETRNKWHEQQLSTIWNNIKANVDTYVKRWP